MNYILTPAQMRDCDDFAIQSLGIPSAILMEDAARSAFEVILPIVREHCSAKKQPNILILCGSGNNGGDGFALARMLVHHASVRVVWIGGREKMSDETAMNFTSCEKHGIPLQHLCSEADVAALDIGADCILDALVGIGGSENLRGIAAALLEKCSTFIATSSTKPCTIAIDIPTGLNAETGKSHQYCFRADYTITMAAYKTGLLLNDAREVCGKILPVPIGIPKAHIAQTARIYALEQEDIRTILPVRNPRSTKHSFGSVAIIGGTSSMSGAPALAANACISAGAGLVRLYAPSIHAAVLPEIMTTRLPASNTGGISLEAQEILHETITQNSVFVIGMGLAREAASLQVVRYLLENILPEKPIVLDADGLRVLHRMGDVEKIARLRENIICTPHRGEFAALTGEDYEQIPDTAHILAPKWAELLGCTILLKNVPTIISNGKISYWNTSGNAGLATAGSGDVLAGIIGAILAQGVSPVQAAALGAYLHGAAADWYAARHSQETLSASRVITSLQEVIPFV
jgi:NAD(P)H-hydrate epimerase